MAENHPFVVDEQQGEKWWCACGQSKNQPYCDGTHKTIKTDKTPIRVEIPEGKRIAWCGCKQSANKPYCDGTHKKL